MIHRYNKKVGSIAASPSMLGLLKNIGVDYITYSVDTGILRDGYSAIIDEWKKL